jgi:hypothetical protein
LRKAEIGNKQIIRALGDALNVVDVNQFPGALSTEPMQMVLPLSLIPYKLVSRTTPFSATGNSLTAIVCTTDPNITDPPPMYRNNNELRLVGGLSFFVQFTAAPTSGDRISVKVVLNDWVNGGNNILWSGNFDTIGFPVDNDRLFYSFGLNSMGVNNNTLDRAPSGNLLTPLLGWIPATCTVSVELQYFSVVNSAQIAFPALSSTACSFTAVESPKGLIPPV